MCQPRLKLGRPDLEAFYPDLEFRQMIFYFGNYLNKYFKSNLKNYIIFYIKKKVNGICTGIPFYQFVHSEIQVPQSELLASKILYK